jgi:hypothetical protein
MDLQATKIELIEKLIGIKNAAILDKIRAILEEEKDQLNDEDYKIIDTVPDWHTDK